MMKYIQIEGLENYPATVYTDRGRFFVDFHDTAADRNGNSYPLPIGSYETIDGVRQALSYHYETMETRKEGETI